MFRRKHFASFANGVNLSAKATFYYEDITTSRVFFYLGAKVTAVDVLSDGLVHTETPHGFVMGDKVRFKDVRQVVPSLDIEDESVVLTVPSSTSFTIALAITTAGVGGLVGKALPHYCRTENLDMILISAFDETPEDDVG